MRFRPKNGPRFIKRNSKDFSKLLSSCVRFYLIIHIIWQIEGKRHTSLSVRDRSFFFFLFFFFNATPWHRATLLSWSATDHSFFFFNATQWHRGTPLSRSATDSFLTPLRGTERYCSLGPRPILFFNATPWHRATPLSRSATDPFLTPPRGTERYCSLGPRPILF